MKKIIWKRVREQRGANLIEFALILPLLLLLVAGAADLGRAFNNYIIITNAAREGARVGSHFPDNEAAIRLATIAEADSSGVTLVDGDIAIDWPGGTIDAGQPIRVSIEYGFATILGGIIGTNELTLRSSVDMIIYGYD